MEYEAILKNDKGEVIKSFKGETVNIGQLSNVADDIRLPVSYGIKNVKGNEDIYSKLLQQVGKTLQVESNEINGLFNISLDNEEIVLKEVFE